MRLLYNRFPILLLLAFAGCGFRASELSDLEASAAGTIAESFSAFESVHPGVPVTNISQIFTVWDLSRWGRRHPALYEEQFRRFGKDAGFDRSFYEKYVFIPKGVANLTPEGEPILMNVRPFLDSRGVHGRYVIYRVGAHDYRPDWVQENRVQAAFRSSGLQIPSPTPGDPVPRPPGKPKLPRSEYSIISIVNEIDRYIGFPVVKILLLALFTALVFLLYWFGFRQKAEQRPTH
jgi:hypothetical protein